MPKTTQKRRGSVTQLSNGMDFVKNSSGKAVKSTAANKQRMVGDSGIKKLKTTPVRPVKLKSR